MLHMEVRLQPTSAPSHAGTYEQWAKDVESLLDAQGIQKAIFMGKIVFLCCADCHQHTTNAA